MRSNYVCGGDEGEGGGKELTTRKRKSEKQLRATSENLKKIDVKANLE